MSERFQQFSGLVDNCEFNRGEKKTTTMDLRGFWEMIYFQVEDVNRKFEALEKWKEDNWMQEELKREDNFKSSVTTTMRKRSTSTGHRITASKATASSGLKALIAAKRKKVPKDDERRSIQEIVTHESEETAEAPCSPERTFNGGFFNIKTPLSNLRQASPSRLTRSAGQPKE